MRSWAFLALVLASPLQAQQNMTVSDPGTLSPASGNCGQQMASTADQMRAAVERVYAETTELSGVSPAPALRFDAKRNWSTGITENENENRLPGRRHARLRRLR